MWHLTKIPKVVHFYWGGSKLSYLRYLSIESFRLHNPDWKIVVHVPSVLSQAAPSWDTFQQKSSSVVEDYFHKIPANEIMRHDFDNYDFDNHAHEVHKSDFLRWKLLAEHGGVWSDIDILYSRSMNCLQSNNAVNAGVDTVLCPLVPPKKHTVGFLMSSQNNEFCHWMHATSRSEYNPNIYQCMGSDILNKNFPTYNSFHQQFPSNQFLFLENKAVYSITSKEIDRFFSVVNNDIKKKINSSSVIGFHWFAGHPISQEFENKLTDQNLNKFDNLLITTIKNNHETHNQRQTCIQ